jgi:hypothetical protein
MRLHNASARPVTTAPATPVDRYARQPDARPVAARAVTRHRRSRGAGAKRHIRVLAGFAIDGATARRGCRDPGGPTLLRLTGDTRGCAADQGTDRRIAPLAIGIQPPWRSGRALLRTGRKKSLPPADNSARRPAAHGSVPGVAGEARTWTLHRSGCGGRRHSAGSTAAASAQPQGGTPPAANQQRSRDLSGADDPPDRRQCLRIHPFQPLS